MPNKTLKKQRQKPTTPIKFAKIIKKKVNQKEIENS